jgi:hypothetical protein
MTWRTDISHARKGLRKKANVDDCPVDREFQIDPADLADRLDHWTFAHAWREADEGVTAPAAPVPQDCVGAPIKERHMSILTHRNHTSPRFGSGGRRAHIQSALRAILAFIRNALWRAGKLIVAVAEVIAEARMQRAMLEAELFFRRHSRDKSSDK